MITESISLSRHYGEIVQTIEQCVATAISKISNKNMRKARSELSDKLLEEFHDNLSALCSSLTHHNIVVYFDPEMKSSGEAYGDEITLNERRYVDYISLTSLKLSSDELFTDTTMKKLIHSMATTLIHEMVHIVQHQSHRDNKRGDYEYRSYLKSPSGESFKTVIANKTSDDANYRRLYHASPQEISAFSHNIVLDILKDNNLSINYSKLSSSEIPSVSALAFSIPWYIEKYINPTTPEERQVYNRYIKLVYQELDRTIDYLKLRS